MSEIRKRDEKMIDKSKWLLLNLNYEPTQNQSTTSIRDLVAAIPQYSKTYLGLMYFTQA